MGYGKIFFAKSTIPIIPESSHTIASFIGYVLNLTKLSNVLFNNSGRPHDVTNNDTSLLAIYNTN